MVRLIMEASVQTPKFTQGIYYLRSVIYILPSLLKIIWQSNVITNFLTKHS